MAQAKAKVAVKAQERLGRQERFNRPVLAELDLPLGKRVRLHRLLYEYGPGQGRLMLLPYDHGLEHGPRDFFANPAAEDPEYQMRLAREGEFSGIVVHIGLAQKYLKGYAGEVPLVLKLNGKTGIPPGDRPFSAIESTVEDALRLGADAVGYTLYIGSPRQDEDFAQLGRVRAECDRYGMPLIIWAYPRGEAVEAQGGGDSIYAVDYAARVSSELGADIVKVNFPTFEETRKDKYPTEYRTHPWSEEELIQKVVRTAGRTMVLVSGGEMVPDEELLHKARLSLEAGAVGFIFGRNLWQRPFQEGVTLAHSLRDLMLSLQF